MANVYDKQGESAKALEHYIRSLAIKEAALGPEIARLAVEERMRAYALSVQNYFKGGDVASARANLGKFKTAFAGKDLYYADGASFSDTSFPFSSY